MSRRTNASNACKVLFTRPGPPSGPRVSAIARLEGAEGQAVLRRVLEAHPDLKREHILAAMDYAADSIANEAILLGGDAGA